MVACFFERRCHSSLLKTITGSRISFRCFDISEHFIGLGSSSGDVFIFSRNYQRLLRQLAAAPAKLCRVAFNPANDNILCVASSRGSLVVIEHNTMIVHAVPVRELYKSEVHANASVVQLIWTKAGTRFIAGDDRGLVSITDFCGISDALLFDICPTNVITLDSRIVQLDTIGERVVISTMTASFLCDLVDKRFTKIGKKSRNGLQGGCFSGVLPSDDSYPSVYCVRPGGRLWEVDPFGGVVCTFSFKHEGSTSSKHIPVPLRGASLRSEPFDKKIQFGVVVPIDDLLMTVTDEALFVLQIHNCDTPRIVWQTTSFSERGITETKVDSDSIFFLHKDGTFTEWGFTMNVLENVFYILPRPEQRFTVIFYHLDFITIRKYFQLIERNRLRGKELILRSTNFHLVCARTVMPYITMKTLLMLVHYFEGITLSLDARYFASTASLFIPYDDVFNKPDEANSRSRKHADHNDNTSHNLISSETASECHKNTRTLMTPPLKQESATRTAHRQLLDRICRRLQKEIADSLLVELNSSLWAAPRIIQENHCIDEPLSNWGISLHLLDECDICGDRLVLTDIEEDVVVHYCGHRLHATCSLSNVLCCICIQNYSDQTTDSQGQHFDIV